MAKFDHTKHIVASNQSEILIHRPKLFGKNGAIQSVSIQIKINKNTTETKIS